MSDKKDGSVMSWIEDDGEGGYILTIAGKDTIIANENSQSLFYGLENLKEIENIELLDTSNVTSMSNMFFYCTSLERLDLSTWNFDNVQNMECMFTSCHNLTTTITIKNNNVNRYANIFYDASTSSNTKIIVNYTAETSSLVDSMIATKSSNSNVVKGVQI